MGTMRRKIKEVLKAAIEGLDFNSVQILNYATFILSINIDKVEFTYTRSHTTKHLSLDLTGDIQINKFEGYANVNVDDLELFVWDTDGDPEPHDFEMVDVCELLTDYINDNLESF